MRKLHATTAITALLIGIAVIAATSRAGSEKESADRADHSKILSATTLEELRPYFDTRDSAQLRTAVLATRFVDDPRTLELLRNLWEHNKSSVAKVDPAVARNPRVRLAMASVLLDKGDKDRDSYRRFIYTQANSPDPELRADAAHAMGSIKDKGAVEALMLLAENDVRDVALSAISGLQKIAIESGSAQDDARRALSALSNSTKITDALVKWQLEDAQKEIAR